MVVVNSVCISLSMYVHKKLYLLLFICVYVIYAFFILRVLKQRQRTYIQTSIHTCTYVHMYIYNYALRRSPPTRVAVNGVITIKLPPHSRRLAYV